MIAVRRADVSDAPVVARLVDALLAELGNTPSKLAQRAEAAHRLLALEDRVFGFLAYDDAQAVGAEPVGNQPVGAQHVGAQHVGAEPVGAMMMSEGFAIYANGAFGIITELFVVPSHRSSGVAQHLIAAGAALGRARGWGRLEVGAPRQPKWARSVQFYLRNGFTEVGPRLRLPL